MLQSLLFALLAASLASAMPTATHITTVTKRDWHRGHYPPGHRHHEAPPWHRHHTWTKHKTTSTSTSTGPCGTASGIPYYIEAVANSQFAVIDNDAIFSDAYDIDFDQPTVVTATEFTFVADAGVCRLGLYTNASIPDTAAYLSYVNDSNGDFADEHIVRIIGPDLPSNTTITSTPVICNNVDSELSCSTSSGTTTENVLQLFEGDLFIATTAFAGTSPVFNLIPAL